MTDIKDLEKKLNVTMVNRDELKQLCKDRMDFGFDSIYFRYAIMVDELARYKEKEQGRPMKSWAESHKQHFYVTLEQLVHAHEEIENDIDK